MTGCCLEKERCCGMADCMFVVVSGVPHHPTRSFSRNSNMISIQNAPCLCWHEMDNLAIITPCSFSLIYKPSGISHTHTTSLPPPSPTPGLNIPMLPAFLFKSGQSCLARNEAFIKQTTGHLPEIHLVCTWQCSLCQQWSNTSLAYSYTQLPWLPGCTLYSRKYRTENLLPM